MKRNGTLYWITGLAGAGKTTIGNRLYYKLKKEQDNIVLLDGDILKTIVDEEIDYSTDSRRNRAFKYARLCKALTDQGLTVICCTIAMFNSVREWNREHNKGYVEIFVDVPIEVLKQRDKKGIYSGYESGKVMNIAGVDINTEFPVNPDIVINNDGQYTINECVNMILEFPVTYQKAYNRDVGYWNNFYANYCNECNPSRFAQSIKDYLKSGSRLLDLGCGNGRDSIYFMQQGVDVTGIDASECAIGKLQEEYKQYKNSSFICDDFVCSRTIYMEQYDYCYSRFSLHAINEEQENILVKNVFEALKNEGYFFIEVRSIFDELYGKGEKIGKDEYIYDGHYRRFVRREVLEKKLLSIGYEIVISEENRDFAPFGDDNPIVIRIVAKKVTNDYAG